MPADLKRYREKRNFERTPEPRGGEEPGIAPRPAFVVQKHAARRLHYDFRLEHDGVLKSWAVPKGPSLDPKERRLAVQTEDHPLDYATFEGVIPEGEYGGGTVLVWDRGYWRPEDDPDKGLAQGKLDFELFGEKLRGGWTLVRMPPRGKDKDNWLLIKRRDREARESSEPEIVDLRPESVLTGRDIDEVAAEQDRVWHSRGDGETEPAQVAAVGRPETVPGAKAAPLPAKVKAQLPTRADHVPDGSGWFHEPKLAGERLLARIEDGEVTLLGLSGGKRTGRFPALAGALEALRCSAALLDGEAVVFDENGVSHAGRLEQAIADGRDDDVVLVAFDLLHLDGWDLRDAEQRARKELLRLLLVDRPRAVRYGEHIEGHGEDFYREACGVGLEGIISKQADAPYRAGRSKHWLEVACRRRSRVG